MTSFDLNDAEWESLKELRSGPLKKRIPLSHQTKLINLGLAKKFFESVMITPAGRRYHRATGDRDNGAKSLTRGNRSVKSLQLVVSNEDIPPLRFPS